MKIIHQLTDESTANAPASIPPPRPRCHHVSRTGRPCRYLGLSPENPFCKDHLPPPPPAPRKNWPTPCSAPRQTSPRPKT
jgi:hypothetical protein